MGAEALCMHTPLLAWPTQATSPSRLVPSPHAPSSHTVPSLKGRGKATGGSLGPWGHPKHRRLGRLVDACRCPLGPHRVPRGGDVAKPLSLPLPHRVCPAPEQLSEPKVPD